ncbi:hypothetical protein EDD27_7998 [Nonomuraea polychroma]|uniref:Uncharacterized protein n=1 Tax=Nonomuraea polychroma TaxID=46176 RepID=A0A438MIF8_9ACTN|nr:hypothetical protein [Nonomuraea polychroma]RVX45211.1 hypothetical protein EDD27_7998 [Nonomuraea polychroma]
MTTNYQVEVRGVLPSGLNDELRRRFGAVVVQSDGDRTMLPNLAVDQAGLRAVLDLLWDVDGELLLVKAIPSDAERGNR